MTVRLQYMTALVIMSVLIFSSSAFCENLDNQKALTESFSRVRHELALLKAEEKVLKKASVILAQLLAEDQPNAIF